MKSNKTLWRAAAVFAFCVGFVLLFTLASRILNDKMSYKYTEKYYTNPKDYEVLFFGSSHVMDGILPLEFYRETGIASYNLGMTGEGMATTYGKLRYALRQSKPQLVVLDVYAVNDTVKVDPEKLGFLHNSLDNMPLCYTKVTLLADVFDGNLDQIFNYLFPISTYHSRFANLVKDDFNPYVQEDCGALPLAVLSSETDWGVAQTAEQSPGGSVGAEYLHRFLALCAEEHVPVLLTALPYRPRPGEAAGLNGVAAVAAEYHVPFLNALWGDTVDPRVDFADADGHLTSTGAAKVTHRLATYIVQNYDIKPKISAGSPQDAAWRQSWDISLNQYANKLRGSTDLHTALMLLGHSGICYRIQLEAASLADSRTQAFLENLGFAEDWAALTAAGTPYVCTGGAAAVPGKVDSAPGNHIAVWNAETGEQLADLAF